MKTRTSETFLYVVKDVDNCVNALVHTKERRVFTVIQCLLMCSNCETDKRHTQTHTVILAPVFVQTYMYY